MTSEQESLWLGWPGVATKYSKDEGEAMGVASKILSLAVGFYLQFDEQGRVESRTPSCKRFRD